MKLKTLKGRRKGKKTEESKVSSIQTPKCSPLSRNKCRVYRLVDLRGSIKYCSMERTKEGFLSIHDALPNLRHLFFLGGQVKVLQMQRAVAMLLKQSSKRAPATCLTFYLFFPPRIK